MPRRISTEILIKIQGVVVAVAFGWNCVLLDGMTRGTLATTRERALHNHENKHTITRRFDRTLDS